VYLLFRLLSLERLYGVYAFGRGVCGWKNLADALIKEKVAGPYEEGCGVWLDMLKEWEVCLNFLLLCNVMHEGLVRKDFTLHV